MTLKNVFRETIPPHKEFLAKIKETHGTDVLGEVTVNHLFKGMRGVPQSYAITSIVVPEKGVLYRGKTLEEIKEILPKPINGEYPTIESIFWFLLTGLVPTQDQINGFIKEIHMYAHVPHHVYNVIDSLPQYSRPMTRLCSGILALTTTSSFQDLYDKGELSKEQYWEYAFDDSIRLIANLAHITAYIYRVYCCKDDPAVYNPKLDWAANFSQMLGFNNEDSFDLFRMFLFTHADHSSSNVSAHTAHTVGSALSNIYYTLSASLLGLAGPLHGNANQQTVVWILDLIKNAKLQNAEIDSNFIKAYVQKTLESGKVVPGYGHAALRVEDPRFTMFYKRYQKRGFNTEILQTVEKIYHVVPDLLKATGKVSNPYPNIDAISGSCLYSEGIKEHEFYTVLFGMSRLFGILAQNIIDRSIGQPIFRPKTVSFETLQGL